MLLRASVIVAIVTSTVWAAASNVWAAPSSQGASTSPGVAPTAAPMAPHGTSGLTMYGAGPLGADNGTKRACTGLRANGAQVLCVRLGASGTGTASAPLGTIAEAVRAARDGDTVQVAGGPGITHAESVRIGDFEDSCDNAGEARNVTILGGFAANFASRDAGRYPTTVTGGRRGPAFVICVMGGRSVVDGFVVSTSGRDRGFIGSAGGYSGEGGTLVISHNVVFGNRPTGTIDDSTYGAGISAHVYAKGTVEVSDNYVHRNRSGRGAGITTQTRPESPLGTMRILRNRVEENISIGSHGGGMTVFGNAEIAHNVIIGNKVTGEQGGGGWGGGFIADGGRPVVAHHNVVMGNYAAAHGHGEFYDSDVVAEVSFELVTANACSADRSSAVLVDIGERTDTTARFRNITVVGHRCPTMTVGALMVQQGARADVRDSVFWDNVGDGGKARDLGIDGAGTLTATGTVTAQAFVGQGNVRTDPGFVNAARGDFRSTRHPAKGAFAPGGLNPRR